ncbi:hypothetical protein BDZ94DRAFT_1156078 [Collybia nuda]|uniref:Uncharacterized protein n=1 Tax=Collybia nuda TaxID=64659 RepID=A0A9P5YF04_9AGAR|nr:hypothetical protein BDZ94DRAFT_1156078 [Collybia nuda]
MSSDVLGNFSCLDELTQVIYQYADKFVVLSTVSDKWTIHLGLAGPEGRWWRGSWGKTEILEIVGSKSSDKLLGTFADKLAETFVQGELYVGNWSAEVGAKIDLTLGPSSKKPLRIPLIEINSEEAAAHATNVFFDIALQAQSRKCHLHPAQYPASDIPLPTLTSSILGPSNNEAASSSTSMTEQGAQAEIKALKAELDEAKKRMRSPPEQDISKFTERELPRLPKGASLANPNKKARKYQALEFESDEE